MGDYGGMKGIVEEARKVAEDEAARLEVACPRCGSLLAIRDGIGNCPMGHYRTTRVA